MTDNPRKARFEAIQLQADRGEISITDTRWLLDLVKMLGQERDRLRAEVIKLCAWHKNNLELISQQAEIIQRANAELAEMSREVGKQAELLRQAGIHLDEMQRQSQQ